MTTRSAQSSPQRSRQPQAEPEAAQRSLLTPKASLIEIASDAGMAPVVGLADRVDKELPPAPPTHHPLSPISPVSISALRESLSREVSTSNVSLSGGDLTPSGSLLMKGPSQTQDRNAFADATESSSSASSSSFISNLTPASGTPPTKSSVPTRAAPPPPAVKRNVAGAVSSQAASSSSQKIPPPFINSECTVAAAEQKLVSPVFSSSPSSSSLHSPSPILTLSASGGVSVSSSSALPTSLSSSSSSSSSDSSSARTSIALEEPAAVISTEAPRSSSRSGGAFSTLFRSKFGKFSSKINTNNNNNNSNNSNNNINYSADRTAWSAGAAIGGRQLQGDADSIATKNSSNGSQLSLFAQLDGALPPTSPLGTSAPTERTLGKLRNDPNRLSTFSLFQFKGGDADRNDDDRFSVRSLRLNSSMLSLSSMLDFGSKQRQSEESEQEGSKDKSQVPETWSESIGAPFLNNLSSSEIRCQELYHELIVTEERYVKNLRVLEDDFIRPMNRQKLVPDKTLTSCIFGNLSDIIIFSEGFLRSLKERRNRHPIITTVHDIILSRIDDMKCYEIYIPTTVWAKDAIIQARKQYPEFHRFMKNVTKNSNTKRLDLISSLDAPRHRLPHIVTILCSVCLTMSVSDPHRDDMLGAYEAMKGVVKEVDNKIIAVNQRIQQRQKEPEMQITTLKGGIMGKVVKSEAKYLAPWQMKTTAGSSSSLKS